MNAIDENFFWSGSPGGIDERANVINELVRRLQGNVGGIRSALGLSDRVDFGNITLIGHSRGAEAVARASVDGAPVGSTYGQVISIAPTDFLATAPAPMSTSVTLPYLLLYGSDDGDVSDGSAFRLYDRATGEKQLVFLRNANHNYFNESWPLNDLTGPNPSTGIPETNDAPDSFNGAVGVAAAKNELHNVADS